MSLRVRPKGQNEDSRQAMQDRYVGDVGDFGKYALLRRLCGRSGEQIVRLGVVWCLFAEQESTNDGRHISYLYSPKYVALDDQLLNSLRILVKSGCRRVSSIATAGILPAETVFFDAPVSGGASGRIDRIRRRLAWLEDCVRLTDRCELTFFDPDNGMEVQSIPKHHPKAGKYIFWDELIPFWQRGNALLIYHHLNRTAPAAKQVQALATGFRIKFSDGIIIPLVFRRGSSRVFWLLHRGDRLGIVLEKRANKLLSGGWSQHFRPFGWPSNDHTHHTSTRPS
jgi:hypothetical protein